MSGNNETGLEIAVIGMAGRFPGAPTIQKFWENLENGVESITFFTEEELREAGIAEDVIANPDYVPSGGGALEEKECFDAAFFGYSSLEAELLDPQVRVFHECSWHALEDAGYDPYTYDGLIGLYAGASPNFLWEALAMLAGKAQAIGEFVARLLTERDYLCTRVSYSLNLRGPSVVVKTACSTSLVAVHMAGQAILNGECDMALAGGVTVQARKKYGYLYVEDMIGSPDGHCRAFDAEARGFNDGEGAGVVLLKRLEDARQDNDTIHAVIKATAINNDGTRKAGYSAPSIHGQADVISEAHHLAEVEPETVTYVETHGTGTIVGDPIEFEALKTAFDTDKKQFCRIGSVKTNIGHLDSAAGVAGLIKTILALKHRRIPPSLFFKSPNPAIDFQDSPFLVNAKLTEWQSNGTPLRAGVSSFGIGGTNSHAVLEEAPPVDDTTPGRTWKLLTLSAKTENALEAATENLKQYLREHPSINLADAAYTLQVGRRRFPYRRVMVMNRAEDVETAVLKTHFSRDEKQNAVFMFPGIGSQYVDMGRDIYEKEPVFREELDRSFNLLKTQLGVDVKRHLYPSENNGGSTENREIDRFDLAQPLIFAMEYALAKLLIHWGIKPHAMIGYSFGEYTAAAISGVFTLEDALKLIVCRGRLIVGLTAGAMLSVPLPAARIKPVLTDGLSIAIDNGPSTIVSGPEEAVAQFEKKLREKRFMAMRVPNSYALHSRMMEPILDEYRQEVSKVTLNRPRIPYISNVTGTWITVAEATEPGYWVRHLRETVRFADGIETLKKEPGPVFVEVGPGRDLCTLLTRHKDETAEFQSVNLLRSRQQAGPDDRYLLNRLGQLWQYGLHIDWRKYYAEETRRRIPMPVYPFERNRYWYEGDPFKQGRDMLLGGPQAQPKAEPADWYYVPQWTRSSLPPESESSTETEHWLLFIDRRPLTELLVERLKQLNHRVTVVRPGESFNGTSGEYTVDPADNDEYMKLFAHLADTVGVPRNIVHTWSIVACDNNDSPLQDLDRRQDYGIYSIMNIARAIGAAGIYDEIRLGAVTAEMQSVTGEEDLKPEQATILGPVKVIPLEYPNIKCLSVDILEPRRDRRKTDIIIRHLLREYQTEISDFRMVAYRGAFRWIEDYEAVRLEEPKENALNINRSSVILLTGALGGMGFALAEELIQDRGAALIMVDIHDYTEKPGQDEWLTSNRRKEDIRRKLGLIEEWKRTGARIQVHDADVSDYRQMHDVVAAAEKEYGKITGLIHTAGQIDYAGIIQRRTRRMTETLLAPKVRGTLVLDHLLKDHPLEIQVLFSSVGNVFHRIKFGQVAYNAGHEFLGVYAYRKRQEGIHAVAVDWNDWTEVGMAVRANEQHHAEENNGAGEDLLATTPREGIDAFHRIVASGFNRVIISTRHLKSLMELINRTGSEDQGVIGAMDQARSTGNVHARPQLDTPYIAPATKTEEILAEIWRHFFSYEQVGIDDDFFELGGDSLRAMTVSTAIHKRMDVRVPLAQMFRTSTIKTLARYIDESGTSRYIAVEPFEEKEYYPLSSTQKRLYILQQIDRENTSYNSPLVMNLLGDIDVKRVQNTFETLIRRHESFRTSFDIVDGETVQKIHRTVDFKFEYADISQTGRKPGKDEELKQINRFVRAFDLSRAPLFRAGMLRRAPQDHILLVDLHHTVTDGVSLTILVREFVAAYSGDPLPPLRIQYKDYAQWQNHDVQKQAMESREAYWLKRFEGEIPVLNLPADYTRPAVQSFEGSKKGFHIGPERLQALKDLALRRDATLYMVLLSLYNILLLKITGQEDIVVGTPVAGRNHADLQNIIGVFVNTVAMRNFPSEKKDYGEFLAELKNDMLDAFENQDYLFEDLVEKVTVNRDVSRNPIFDTMFALQNVDSQSGEVGPIAINDLSLSPYRYDNMIAIFDMSLICMEQENGMVCTLEYCTRLFDGSTIQRIIGYFERIVTAVLETPGIHISEIEIISEAEKNQVLHQFNGDPTQYPRTETLHGLFEAQVERTPDHMAVAMAGTTAPTNSLTYRELNRNAHRMARRLKTRGVKPGYIVAIISHRSPAMLEGIFGILKTGAAYLPIAPDTPIQRIRYIVADSAAPQVLCCAGTRRKLETGDAEEADHLNLMTLEHDGKEDIPETAQGNDARPVDASGHPAYCIYTSGSTGKPKGVVIEHRAAVNRLNWMQNRYPIGPTDVILQKTPIIFDVSVWELFWWSQQGAGVLLLGPGDEKSPEKILEAVETGGITIMHFVPSMLDAFLEYLESESPDGIRLSTLKRVFASGEALTARQVERFNRLLGGDGRSALINLYGPTEATVDVSYFDCPKQGPVERVPIGKPIENISLYVVNRQTLHHQPVGIPGELMIAGDGLGRGYLNRPELTAETFIANPENSRQRWYRTGDLVKWLPDGNIDFLGRIDHQVKIRGFRIELGEIEERLLNHPDISAAVVTAAEDAAGDKALCAYFTAAAEQDNAALRQYMAEGLPEYMVPAYMKQLEQLPLTPTGKVDRRALPAPVAAAADTYTAPRNHIERILTAIWADILRLDAERIGIDARFFEMGGHSLRATVMITRIHKELNVRVPLAEIFKTPTVRGLAQYIENAADETHRRIEPAEEREYYTMSSGQQRLYILQQMDPGSIVYNISQVMKLDFEIDVKKVEDTFKQLIRRHESFRTAFITVNEEPVQRVCPEVAFTLAYVESGQGNAPAALDDIIGQFLRPFDLSKPPLLRVGVIRTPDNGDILMVDMHHIVSDGVTMEILLRDFMAHYDGRRLPELQVHYKDYAVWQNSAAVKEQIRKQQQYWLALMGGDIPVLELPYDYPRPTIQSFQGNRVRFEIQPKETAGLKTRALEDDVTLFMVLNAAVNILLSKLSGQEDIIIGTPIAGRRHADLEPVAGMFINTLALRNAPQGNKTLREFLAEIKERTLQAYENQDAQFEDLVEKLDVKRDTGRNPLFDVMLVLQNMGDPGTGEEPGKTETDRETDATEITGYGFDSGVSRFDITVDVTERRRKLAVNVEYANRLFKRETITRFIGYFETVVAALIQSPEQRIRDIDILSHHEKQQILGQFNRAPAQYPTCKTIARLLDEQTRKSPDRIAAICRESNRQLTYAQLNRRAANLARRLAAEGVRTGDIVALVTARTLDMLIGIYGIHKAGAAYLPIDPQYPAERIRFILKDSQPAMVLKEKNVPLTEGIELAEEYEPTAPLDRGESVPAQPHHPAYIIYTSGSTGRPKGVQVEHRSAVNLLYGLNDRYPMKESDRYLFKTSYIFDVSVTEIFGCLISGSGLVVLEQDAEKDPEAIIGAVAQSRITHMNFVPAMFTVFVDMLNPANIGKLSNLDIIFLAGEELLPGPVRKFEKLSRRIRLENLYGPTEATVYASLYPLTPGEFDEPGEKIPIGKPVPNTELYILDRYGNYQGIGIPGELHIGGDGVAAGYLNNPELTAQRFVDFIKQIPDDMPHIPHISHIPQEPDTGKENTVILYKTGDLARWRTDGNIEYMGRIDHQVKVRGYRIEPGEIENRLQALETVREAVVTVGEDHDGHRYLSAYFVAAATIDTADLRDRLAASLPDYMVPSFFKQLEKMPLTPGGKIDRRNLPRPDALEPRRYTAPRNSMETRLVGIWADVLDREPETIGIDSRFFDIGGHSLRATIMIGRIHREMDVRVPLTEIFKNQTIRGLAEFIARSEKERYIAVEAVEEKEYYPLSSGQRRLYVLQQMDLDSTVYNVTWIFNLEEHAEPDRLERLFKQLLQRHESLRTTFETINDIPVQRVHKHVDFSVDYRETPEEDAQLAVRKFIRPFDLSQAPLIRVGLLQFPDKRQLFMMDIHHIISDGLSLRNLTSNFRTLFLGGELPPLRLQYKDYAEWLNKETTRGVREREEQFWQRQFEGEIPVLNLPTDNPRPAVQNFEGAIYPYRIGYEETAGLRKMAREQGVTMFMIIMAVLNVWLSKLNGQEDIVIGTPVSGRHHADLEPLVGLFINTLALRNFPGGNLTFTEFLDQLKMRTLDAFENQDYQYEDLVDQVAVDRDAGRNPLFDVMFGMFNPGDDVAIEDLEDLSDLGGRPEYEFDSGVARFDMTIIGRGRGRTVILDVEYSTRLFKKETVERFMGYLNRVIWEAVINAPNKKISEIEIVTPGEKQRILYDFNRSEAHYPEDKTVIELFDRQVSRTPDRLALEGRTAGGEAASLTYRQMQRLVRRQARYLRNAGAGPGRLVALLTERSLEMVIGIYAVLEAGAAYLPIEPATPTDRIAYMLADSGAAILQVGPGTSYRGPTHREVPLSVIPLEGAAATDSETGGAPADEYHTESAEGTAPGDLAYVIYTSGSTGRPKGVMVENKAVVNLLYGLNQYYPMTEADRYLFKTSYIFDVSVSELFGWIAGGSGMAVLDRGAEKDPDAILEAVGSYGITHMNFVPAMFTIFLEALKNGNVGEMRHLKYIFLAGEELLPEPVNRFRDRFRGLNTVVRLANLYGPTESTVYASRYDLPAEDGDGGGKIPIGCPVPNIRLTVTDANGYLQGIGIPGQLHIAGKGLARGYLNNPELTAERFVNDFSGDSNTGNDHSPVQYKTGDLARWLPDGNIEFLGRIDHQVKIRGYRIEPGEIEARLLAHDAVVETVVTVNSDSRGDKSLCAYVVCNGDTDIQELKDHLARTLPEYMVPSYFKRLESMPLTAGGKIDRKGLPKPETVTGGIYIEPRDRLERQLVEIWAEVLEIGEDIIGIDSRFFDLGGHSLRATIILGKVQRQLGVRVPLGEIFRRPSVRGMAEYIRAHSSEQEKDIGTAPQDDNLVLLNHRSPAADNLFFVHDGSGEVTAYMEFCRRLDTGLNCLGLKAEELRDCTPRNTTIPEIAAAYLQRIRRFQPEGPYRLAGWSLGGTVVFEMIRQLEQQGENVAFAALIDTPGPDTTYDKTRQPFSVKTETEYLQYYLPGETVKEVLGGVTELDGIWPQVVRHLELSGFDVQKIKEVIVRFGAQVLPNYQRLGLKEALYYLNMGRTLTNARGMYEPRGTIRIPLHCFYASQSETASRNGWDTFSRSRVNKYEVRGDHFSIFGEPEVEAFAQQFSDVYKRRI